MGSRRAAPEKRFPSVSAPEQPDALRIRLLGGFRVSVGPMTIEDQRWRRRKAASLIKALTLAPGHRLHRERIMDLLWPELAPAAAANNLHRTLYLARRILEPVPASSSRYLQLNDETIYLCSGTPPWVDVEAFESAAAAAQRTQDPAAYRAATELYAGELLPEDRHQGWTEARRESLRETCLVLLVELAVLYEERREFASAISALDRAVALDPTREELHYGLMRLQAMAGQHHKALLQYEQLWNTLSLEPGAEPGARTKRLYREIRAGRVSSAIPPDGGLPPEISSPVLDNLPAAQTSFVGREREKQEVENILSRSRLLTLTGAGGSGKTRLALEVGREVAATYPDGVWLVELAALTEGKILPNAVAETLGVLEQPGRPLTDTLVGHLRPRRMLLILDNCEHLVEAAAQFANTLLSACEHLRILATSREALGVAGEVTWLVLSLTVPDAVANSDTRSVARYEAVRLFVERARSRLPAFDLTPENAQTVANICRRLDGMPLAIELATARMDTLAAEHIAEQLDNSLELLADGGRTGEPRHQTLETTLDWSHELLSGAEQALFRRLSALAGGWTLEAAEQVCSGGGIERDDVMDLHTALVDKSLVVAEVSAEAAEPLRYRMLEPVRQYSREKLRESAEAPLVRRRHAEHYLDLATTAEPELVGVDQGKWLQRLRTEFPNLRAALAWSLERGDDERERGRIGLRLAAALGERFWSVEGFEEGKRWLGTALQRDPEGNPGARAKVLANLGFILLFQQDYARAIGTLEHAVALQEELGDASGAAVALGNLGYAVLHGGYHERVPAFVREGEAMMAGDLDDHARAFLRIVLACAAIEEGDLESAAAQLEDSLALCRELGDLRDASMALFILGSVELTRNDLERAAALLQEGAGITRRLGDVVGVFYFSLGLARLAAKRADPLRAARLWGAVEATQEYMGMALSRFDLSASDYERDVASARSAVDPIAWEAAWSEGKAMSNEQAIDYALSLEEPVPPAASVSEESAPSLTRPRARGRPPHLARSHKPPDLLRTLHLPAHRHYPRGPHPEQAGCHLPGAGSRLDGREVIPDAGERYRKPCAPTPCRDAPVGRLRPAIDNQS